MSIITFSPVANFGNLSIQHIISITCNYVDCCLTFLGKVFIDLRSPGGGDGRWQQRRRRRQVRRRLRGRPSLSSKGFSFFEEIWNKRETYCKSCIALCRSSVWSTFNFGVYWFETYEKQTLTVIIWGILISIKLLENLLKPSQWHSFFFFMNWCNISPQCLLLKETNTKG